jgi:hypothetical protein
VDAALVGDRGRAAYRLGAAPIHGLRVSRVEKVPRDEQPLTEPGAVLP